MIRVIADPDVESAIGGMTEPAEIRGSRISHRKGSVGQAFTTAVTLECR